MHEAFRRFSNWVSAVTGSSWAFIISLLIIIVWGVTGPIFHFSDTWQLIINTGTTIVTFLMVFLIQNTQNRDSKAIHLKLDELIRAMEGARDSLVDLEDCTDEELAKLQAAFARLRLQQTTAANGGIVDFEEKLDQRVDERVDERVNERVDERVKELRPTA